MSFMKKAALAVIISGAGSVAHADIVGANVDAAYWQVGSSGGYDIAGQEVDFEDSLGIDGDSSYFVSAAVEHPVPLIPNVKLGYSSINQSGEGNIQGDFAGLSAGESVTADWSMDFVDGTFYYEILDNWVNIDAGLTIRAIESNLEVVSQYGSKDLVVDAVLPMIYGKAQLDLPFSGWSLGAEVNGVSFDGDSITDGQGYVQYEKFGVAHARVGYRTIDVSVSYSGQSIDGDISGAFVGVGVDF